jgi:altronate dehydratase
MQKAYQVDKDDNVAIALEPLESGSVILLGSGTGHIIKTIEPIPKGHKLALNDIRKGEYIIKYHVVIGEATKDIKAGAWVHLHCMKSLYDERSSNLDVYTGVSKDIRYE